jgi:hypothetical protein
MSNGKPVGAPGTPTSPVITGGAQEPAKPPQKPAAPAAQPSPEKVSGQLHGDAQKLGQITGGPRGPGSYAPASRPGTEGVVLDKVKFNRVADTSAKETFVIKDGGRVPVQDLKVVSRSLFSAADQKKGVFENFRPPPGYREIKVGGNINVAGPSSGNRYFVTEQQYKNLDPRLKAG